MALPVTITGTSPVKLEYSQEVCWICECTDQDLHDLAYEQTEMLTSLTRIQGNHYKPMTRRLCRDCIKRLHEAYRFVQQCIEAENRLQITIAQQQVVKVELEETTDECSFEIKSEQEDDPHEESADGQEEEEVEEEEEEEEGIDENGSNEFDPEGDQEEQRKDRARKEYRCKQCDRVFKKIDSLKYHEEAHLGVKKFSCETCGKKFAKKSCLKRHVKNVHHNIKSIVCSVCGQAFNEKYQLKVHSLKHVIERNYACEHCSRRYKSASNLSRHMAKHDPIAKASYDCDICHQTLSSSSALYTHKLRHTEPGFICSVCGKGFSLNSLLKRHMRSHSDERPYECSECHARFKQEKTWHEHKLIHTKEKPHQCDVCERRFRTRSQVNCHKFLHTGLRPYVCFICKKDFNRPWNLRLHMKTHEKSTPDDGKETEKGDVL